MNYSEQKSSVTAEYVLSTCATAVIVRAVVDIPEYGEVVWYKVANEDEDTVSS